MADCPLHGDTGIGPPCGPCEASLRELSGASPVQNNLDAIAALRFSALSSPEDGEKIRDGLIAELRWARSALARMQPVVEWAQQADHLTGCPAAWNEKFAAHGIPPDPCVCGRDAVLELSQAGVHGQGVIGAGENGWQTLREATGG